MNTLTPATVFPSTVMHSRRFPVAYRFSYRVFSLLVDIDRLAEVGRNPLFSINHVEWHHKPFAWAVPLPCGIKYIHI